MDAMQCRWCGEGVLELGYLEELGHGNAKRDVAWIAGPVTRSWSGMAKRQGRHRRPVSAYRCPQCSHVELFVARHP